MDPAGDVAAVLRVQEGRIRGQGRFHPHDGGQRVDLDELGEVLGDRPAAGDDHADGLADVAHGVDGQRDAVEVLSRDPPRGGQQADDHRTGTAATAYRNTLPAQQGALLAVKATSDDVDSVLNELAGSPSARR